ncbi:hypothetical protein NPIL_366871 [Nephila pilipes]|uniref:Uncharacterized protein n=1 Tax=Nephila pilipes TaxID=299642 RepID=A0A8X6Q2A2_NEPPI|nr:hypothetical protein NPIL_366871 [Nephila pilipes]
MAYKITFIHPQNNIYRPQYEFDIVDKAVGMSQRRKDIASIRKYLILSLIQRVEQIFVTDPEEASASKIDKRLQYSKSRYSEIF